MNTPKCPVCWVNIVHRVDGDSYIIECPRCGEFRISRTAANQFQESPVLGENDSRIRANLSAWIRQRRPKNTLTTYFLDKDSPDGYGREYWTIATPNFNKRADLLLQAIERKTSFAGMTMDWEVFKDEYIADSWSINIEEVLYLLKYMQQENYIEGGVVDSDEIGMFDLEPSEVRIAPKGWARLEQLQSEEPKSSQGFVAMWFDDSMKDFYTNVLALAIEKAGYTPFRIDNKRHANKIDDEIVVEIRKSKFLVADFTGHRGGVYFESGYAMGLGIPVIWTCKKGDMNKLHFDIRQYNCLPWNDDNLDEFIDELKNSILAVVGPGPNYRAQ